MRDGSVLELPAALLMQFARRVGRGEGEARVHVEADAGSQCLSVSVCWCPLDLLRLTLLLVVQCKQCHIKASLIRTL